MKFELRRSEFKKSIEVLQVTLSRLPEQAFVYRQKTSRWIAKARKKFEKYSPEKFVQKVEAVESRRRTTQDE
jgi:hypothetical protein